MILKYINKRLLLLLLGFSNLAFSGTTPFITIWETSPDRVVEILVFKNQRVFDYTIDWGDGSITTNNKDSASHIYAVGGTYTISITGDFPHCRLGYGSMGKLLSVEQWGNNDWTTMENMFDSSGSIEFNATDMPNLTKVRDMSYMFASTTLTNLDVSGWNVSNVANMSGMFSNTNFNEDIGINNWDVSQVKDMSDMFSNSNFNQDINNWDVSKVTNMSSMFSGTDFSQNINNWDVSKVTNMSSMFSNSNFNQNIDNWDVSRVANMSGMFFLANFNQYIGSWDVSGVTNMKDMFSHARLFNQDISNWNVSNVTNMHSMFYFAVSFNQDIGKWNVGNVTTMASMLSGLKTFDQNLGNWDVGKVTNMNSLLFDVQLSVENYDALLIGWSKQNLQQNVQFSGGPNKYCQGANARASIITNYNWQIFDGGPVGNINSLSDQFAIASYTFPEIAGTNLTGEERYYTKPNGYGITYNAGDTIQFNDFDSYPITLYIYEPSCGVEQSFHLLIESVPSCSTLKTPLPESVNVSIATGFSWAPITNATGYKLSIGTTINATDILNAIDVGNILTYKMDSYLPEDTRIYVKIIPYNDIGDALCDAYRFTTEFIEKPDIPKFFTPNNDNRNDTWVVQNTENGLASVFIYNRYGTLVKQVVDFSKGWDGTYRNKPLPSDDYWYFITYKNGKVAKGHFSLVRR